MNDWPDQSRAANPADASNDHHHAVVDRLITIRRPHVVQPGGQPPVDPDAADGLFLLTAAGLIRTGGLFAYHGTAVVVQLLEDAADAILNNPDPEPEPDRRWIVPPGDFSSLADFVQVVTRYGGHRHLARKGGGPEGRHYTLCLGTSSWTIQSWETPDHPLGLSVDDMRALPACPRCLTLVPVVKDDVEDYGPDLLVEVGDCAFHGSCARCKKHLGTIRPDQSLDVLGELWDRHANTERCPGDATS